MVRRAMKKVMQQREKVTRDFNALVRTITSVPRSSRSTCGIFALAISPTDGPDAAEATLDRFTTACLREADGKCVLLFALAP